MGKELHEWLDLFPNLRTDAGFKITSPETDRYNCIAWACERNDLWIWPPLAGMPPAENEYWPDGIPEDIDVSSFVKVFQHFGFERCENDKYEEGYTKIALYVYADSTICSHAARQLRDGTWTSKLGFSNDIIHSEPQSISGPFYGNVYCFMKRNREILI